MPQQILVGGFDLLFGEAEFAQEVEIPAVGDILAEAEAVQDEIFAQDMLVEGEGDIEDIFQRRFELGELVVAEPFGLERFMIDERRVAQRLRAGRVGDDRVGLLIGVAEARERRRERNC